MEILVVGATGYVGHAVARRLLDSGHRVYGLARNAKSEKFLRNRGFESARGDLHDPGSLSKAAAGVDAVVVAASSGDWSVDRAAACSLMEPLAARKGAFIYTSGSAVLSDDAEGEPSGRVFAEDDAFTPPPVLEGRVRLERDIRTASGVRGIVIRPPLIWGNGGSTQVNMLIRAARETGFSPYVGRGLNRWSTVHIDDVADLYRLAIEKGDGGALYHADAGEVDFCTLARWVGAAFTPPLRAASWTLSQAADILGLEPIVRHALASNSRTSCAKSIQLGWLPTRPSLEQDLVRGSYRQLWRRA